MKKSNKAFTVNLFEPVFKKILAELNEHSFLNKVNFDDSHKIFNLMDELGELFEIEKSRLAVGSNVISQVDSMEFKFFKTAEKLLSLFNRSAFEITEKICFDSCVLLERTLKLNPLETEFLPQQGDRESIPIGDAKSNLQIGFILDNLRSAFNVGAALRLADCVGAHDVYLTGYTCGPENLKLQKTSMGAINSLNIYQQASLELVLEAIKSQGYRVVALETISEKSINLYDLALSWSQKLSEKIFFLVGNERFGIDPDILKKVDIVCHIPMMGIKNSLNVVNALAGACYVFRYQDQIQSRGGKC